MKNELEKTVDKRMVDTLRKHCQSRNHALSLVHKAFPSKWGIAGEEAEMFLLEQLQNGPKRLSRLIDEAEKIGINYRTLRRAGIKLNIDRSVTGWGKNRIGRWGLEGSMGKRKP